MLIGPSHLASAAPRIATSRASAKHLPVLGEKWFKYVQGFGKVRPSLVGFGGDPTSFIRTIHWKSWGGSRVSGTGSAVDDSSGVPVYEAPTKTATIMAFDLGTCNNRKMYQGVEWYFPEDGQKFNSKQFANTCNGDYPGPKIGSKVQGVYPQKTYPACTSAAIKSALSAGTLDGFGCYGSFAYAFVIVNQYAEITALLLAKGSVWKTVNGQIYCYGAVPLPIYEPACDSN